MNSLIVVLFASLVAAVQQPGNAANVDQPVYVAMEKRGQCAAKYRNLPNVPIHSACLNAPTKSGDGISWQDRNLIVNKHNELRRGVNPIATNMQTITWDNEIAMIAQKWASNCKYGHDSQGYTSYRDIPGRFKVGQNIYKSWGYGKSWNRAIMEWYNEVQHFKYNSGSTNGKAIGHYTQIVWATTNKIGCGYAKCGGGDYYVCNYGPAGNNMRTQNTPYKTNGQTNGNSGNQGGSTGGSGQTNGNNGSQGGSTGNGGQTTGKQGCTYKGKFIELGKPRTDKVQWSGRWWNRTCTCTFPKPNHKSVSCSFSY